MEIMDLLLLGSSYFHQALTELGHRVVWAGPHPDCDLKLRPDQLDLPYIIRHIPCKPDAVVLTDDLGGRVFPSGLEKISMLKVWYGVDSPINLFWQKHYAPLFDLVLSDQKNCAAELDRLCPAGAHWLPVAVDARLYAGPAEAKKYDLAFVGVIDKSIRPKRSRIVNLAAGRGRLVAAGGRGQAWVAPIQAGRLYRQSRLVLNENLFDGVTTRVFEAMASGTMLLTEAGNNGLRDLFTPGEDLAVFGPDNLIELIDYYLAAEEERERIARRGQEKVLTGHDIRHRARKLVELIGQTKPGTGLAEGGRFFACLGKVLFLTGLRWPAQNGLERLIQAEKLLTQAGLRGAADAETLFYLGLICKFKKNTKKARDYLRAAAEAGSLQARLGLGYLELEGGRLEQATKHFQLLDLDFPKNFPSAENLSPDQHLALGRVLEAAGHDLTPGFSRARLDPALWTALEHFREALRLNPNFPPALAALGDLLLKQQAYAEAEPFLARAAALEPRSAELAQKAEWAAVMAYNPAGRLFKVA